ncbi:hypothetical protein CGZ92_05975 [Parenemella sanctibonifatiensis]|uniref:Uncharacterized protein n=1 Tax=Parenemella sanctibonifatiensis TaxID=2016505 RepID=A0A255EI55_9ACTN|nr:hypothetical protein CGZ92_05975 [Parenemella sanctibonifatiensis]
MHRQTQVGQPETIPVDRIMGAQGNAVVTAQRPHGLSGQQHRFFGPASGIEHRLASRRLLDGVRILFQRSHTASIGIGYRFMFCAVTQGGGNS